MSKSSNKKSSSNEIVEHSSKSAKKGRKRDAGEAFQIKIEEKVEKQITFGSDDTDPNNMDNAEPMVNDVPLDIRTMNLKNAMQRLSDQKSRTLFAGNVSSHIRRANIEKFFKEVGEVVDVGFYYDEHDAFQGTIRVEFESYKIARRSLRLSGRMLVDKVLVLHAAPEEISKEHNQKDGDNQFPIVYVQGFVTAVKARKLVSILTEHFSFCGKIKWVHIPTDSDTAEPMGYAYIRFRDDVGLSNALKLDGCKFGAASLQVRKAKVLQS